MTQHQDERNDHSLTGSVQWVELKNTADQRRANCGFKKNTPIQVSPAERAERVRKMRCMTQSEYNHLLAIVVTVVPRELCDPTEALSHGLLIAVEKYDGRGALTTYVSRCAWIYALQQVKKRRRLFAFSDLQTNTDFADYLDSVLPYLEDPRYVEVIDELFIRRIEEIMQGMYDWRQRYATRESIYDAIDILGLFRDNANLGKGVGVDEYEEAAPQKRRRTGRRPHNTKVVRKQIVTRLSEEFKTDKRNIFSALKALRLSTRQALHEGWLTS